MDVTFQHHEQLIRPWRTAAIVAAAVAAAELLVLVVVGGALIAKPADPPRVRAVAKQAPAAKPAAGRSVAVGSRPAAAPAPQLARTKVAVLVLNGNGRQGAAAATASRVSRRGYRIRGVANAPRTDFTRSLVMYRKGFEGEARRLALDLGVRIVGPLDGLRSTQLRGAHTVVVVGA